MNLHLMPDEKVISRTILSFEEALPCNNRYVVLQLPSRCKYVKLSSDNIHYCSYGSELFWNVVGDISQYKFIIIHYLSFDAVNFINSIKHNGIVWAIWGADLYNNILQYMGYQLFEDPISHFFYSLRYSLKNTIKHSFHICQYHRKIEKAVKSLSYIASFSDCDYNLFKHYFPTSNASFKQFFYYPIDSLVSFYKEEELGNNIILGNSASFTNNHAGALKLLASTKTKRIIITPVSYGAGKQYVNRIGKKYCPLNFSPINNFLSLDIYNNLLLSAYTFIYPHFRQEGMGNILTALYIGGTVFLYNRNPLFNSLQKMGFTIFPIEELSQKIDYRLSSVEKMNNKEIAQKLFGTKKQLDIIKQEFS